MNQLKRSITLFCCLFISVITFGQTQLQMNQGANSSYLKADKELNVVYGKILNEYKADTAFIKNFKASQRIWIQFRDAEMKAMYPDRESGYYGSIQPTCWSSYLTELTKERTKKITIWLVGIEEGDACAGSVKRK